MNKKITLGLLLVALLLSSLSHLLAQSLDPAFQPTTLKGPTSSGPAIAPTQVVKLPDGRLLVIGGFDFSNGLLASKIQRLNPDGTNDASFNPGGTGANGLIEAIVLLPNGKIIIAGDFTSYNGVPVAMIARLTATGALDATFSSAQVGAVRRLTSLAVQADGKILVGSLPSFLTGQAATGGVIRLNVNGSRDASFNVGAGTQGHTDSQLFYVRTLLVQTDGKILVGGSFAAFDGRPASSLVRLNANGSFDEGFITGKGFTRGSGRPADVRALLQQPDGKILVGGSFQKYDTKPSSGLVRLLSNGNLDNTLDVGTGFTAPVYALHLESNGQILVGGDFEEYNGTTRIRLARLSSTGTLDTGFGGIEGFDSAVTSIVAAGANGYVVSGFFTRFQKNNQFIDNSGLVRLDAAGNLDADFKTVFGRLGQVYSVTPLADASLLVHGSFSEFNGQSLPGAGAVVHVRSDGTLDPLYRTAALNMLGGRPDGTFYSASYFFPSRDTLKLQRILPSGKADNSFASLKFNSIFNTSVSVAISGVITQTDGRLVVFGNFINVEKRASNGIVRLLANGTLDNSFTPITNNAEREVSKAFVQPDGKIVVVYTEPPSGNGSTGTFVERLTPNGAVDPTFTIGTGAGPGSYFSVFAQPNGQLLVSGDFNSFNGQTAPGLVRLTTTGTVDNTFAATTGAQPQAVQADGRILALAGNHVEAKLVRLNSNGSLDQSFAPVSLPQAIIVADDFLAGLALQANDTKILLWGSFRSVLGQQRIGLARLNNAPAVTTGTSTAKTTLPVEVYPNPAQHAFRVALPKAAGAIQATLTDALGREVRHYQWVSEVKEAMVEVGSLAAGLYTLRLTGEQNVYVQKVQIAR